MSATMKVLLVMALFLATSVNAQAAMDEKLKEEAQAINSACKTDAANAGCAGEVVGKGLLKCLRAYKQAHKEYKFTDACREAVKEFREERKAEKK